MTLKQDIKVVANYLKDENYYSADMFSTEFLQHYPKDPQLLELQRIAHDKLTIQRFPGPNYQDWLKWFHLNLRPKLYLEVGVETGQSLQHAVGYTKVIGIDPEPRITFGFEAWTRIYKMTSDDYFKTHNVKEELGMPIDLAFIDGLHHYDQALRDFRNIEKNSTKETVVLFHDIYPAIPATARREWTSIYWAGDTWKVFLALQMWRPDLTLYTIPAYPTGLGVVTNLDPNNIFLDENFDTVVSIYDKQVFEYNNPVHLIKNDFNEMKERLFL